jgi:hypothetical protein
MATMSLFIMFLDDMFKGFTIQELLSLLCVHLP